MGKFCRGKFGKRHIQYANFFLANIYKYSEMIENRSADLPSSNAIISNESPKFPPPKIFMLL